MKLDIPPLSQRNVIWKDKRMGGNGTISRYGCLVICHTMALRYFGHDVMPDTLNEIFKTRGAYDGNYLNFYAVGEVFDDYLAKELYRCETEPCDLTKIDEQLSRKQPVIALVDFDCNPADGVDSHFVLIIGKAEDGAYFINDPWTGEIYFFHAKYGEPKRFIYGLRTYEGTPPEETTEDTINELTEKLRTTNEMLADKALEVSILVEKKTQLENKVNNLQKQLAQTRSEKDTLSWEKDKLQVQVKTLDEMVERQDKALSSQKKKVKGLKSNLVACKEASVDGLSTIDLLILLLKSLKRGEKK